MSGGHVLLACLLAVCACEGLSSILARRHREPRECGIPPLLPDPPACSRLEARADCRWCDWRGVLPGAAFDVTLLPSGAAVAAMPCGGCGRRNSVPVPGHIAAMMLAAGARKTDPDAEARHLDGMTTADIMRALGHP